ncbi:MAG: PilC/PilY family type IV pilus protein, partial [Gammaproteobacteria bacterium]|nr:PilC/PilY family type IV pilus protein [Gammaproteobacteria bacterium]
SPGSPALQDADIDCRDDNASGTHGHRSVDTTTRPYPKDNSDLSDAEKAGLVGVWTANAAAAESFDAGDYWFFYTANYMNWHENYRILKRITAVQQVLLELMDELSDINVGIMRFDAHQDADGGMVIHEVVPLAGNQAILKQIIRDIRASGSTPLQETYLEAALYYTGLPVTFGTDSHVPGNPDAVLAPSVDASYTGSLGTDATYISPIEFECQTNHVILLSDGLPTNDRNMNQAADVLLADAARFKNPWTPGQCSDYQGACLDDLARFLYDNDLVAGIDGDQLILTHTIGFDLDATGDALLTATAAAGGGAYYPVSSGQALKDAIQEIIVEVVGLQSSFTAPAVSVNAFNRTQHLNDLYFTVFKPTAYPRWDGNLKKYQVALDAVTGEGIIVDVQGAPAVNELTGFFKDTVTSYWTPPPDSPDGGSVLQGGALSKVPDAANRNIYSDISGVTNLLSSTDNIFDSTNVSAAELGAGSDIRRDALVDWAYSRKIGDPLHSRPAVITYNDSKSVVYFGSNDGFLHAVDAATGIEEFAFLPKALWENLRGLEANTVSRPKIYGMDLPVVPYIEDVNGNGIIESNDKVHVFAGMRRGGRNYYGLDVSDPAAPRLLWKIEGGSGDFSELALTFSEPVHARVDVNGTATDVLVFGGGFDPTHLDNQARYQFDDTAGRGIYIVDAGTGALLWSAGPAGGSANLLLDDMTHSIPARPAVIDLNGDGLADRIYVGDMGGRLWRFDIINGESGGDLVRGGLIASLGAGHLNGSGRLEEQSRRFFNSVDVSLVSDNVLGTYLSLAIGSGERQHPNATDTVNSFYMIKDPVIYDRPQSADYAAIYGSNGILRSDLVDIDGSYDDAALNSARGWYFDLAEPGEKVLAESVTIRNQLVFTTFDPSSSASACDPGLGTARMYILSATDGRTLFDLNGDDVLD